MTTTTTEKPATVAPVMVKNHFALVLDASASMSHGAKPAAHGVPLLHDAQLQVLREAKDQENYVSCFRFGGAQRAQTDELYYQRQAGTVPALTGYTADGYDTPLVDGVMRAIGRLDDGRTDMSKFVLVLTDGQENASKAAKGALAQKIAALKAENDMWTFVFLVPPGNEHYVTSLGVPKDNVRAWTSIETATEELRRGTEHAVAQRRAGVRSVVNYFMPDASKVTTADLAKLRDVTSAAKTFEVTKEEPILEFVNRKTKGRFKPGTAFYLLQKKEREVQDYKLILLREKASGKILTGTVAEVRALLGLPITGTIPMAPGNHAGYDLFVMSNSNNRKLPRGTTVVVWDPTA